MLANWTLERSVTYQTGRILSIYSWSPATAITSAQNVTVTQTSSGVIHAHAAHGPYDVVNAGHNSLAVASAAGPWSVSCDLPILAGAGTGLRSTFLVFGGSEPALAGAVGTYTTTGETLVDMTSRSRVYNRVYAAVIYKEPGDGGIPAGRAFNYATNSTGTYAAAVGVCVIGLKPKFSVDSNTAIPESKSYNAPMAGTAEGGFVVEQSHAYIVPNDGQWITKVQSYTAPPYDPLDYQRVPILKPYVVAGILADDLQLVSKSVNYVVAGMDVTLLPQDLEKYLVYVVSSYDLSGRLFQGEDTMLGPSPPEWRIDLTYPYVDVKDGQFSFFSVTGGVHTLILMRPDGTVTTQRLELLGFTRYELFVFEPFEQIALLQVEASDVVVESVRKRMLTRRIPSAAYL